MIRVVAAEPNRYVAALSLVFRALPFEERSANVADILSNVRRGRVTLDGLLIAESEGAVVGAILYVLQQDGTAFVWPPGVSAKSEKTGIADLLLCELVARIDRAGAWIGQCFVDPWAEEDRATLARNGFRSLTDMRFLIRRFDGIEPEALLAPCTGELDRSTLERPDPEVVTFEPQVNEGRFARLLERTYVQTRDCPELEGTRSGEQALVGHRMSGSADPQQWRLYRWLGRDAGVLLMNDHPSQDLWEVVYMGVAPEFRGKGLGRHMLLQGLHAARGAERSGVMLAVDCRNKYADEIYASLGFVETAKKSVYIRVPPRSEESLG